MESTDNAQTYSELLSEYDKLNAELTTLKKECEENTIIQSMNDMKTVYESQRKKIEKLTQIMEGLTESIKSVQLMLKVLTKNTSVAYRRENLSKFELKTRMEFINEILSDSLKTKNELYYISID